MSTMAGDPILTADEVGELLGVKPKTLEEWRRTGYGPPFIRVGRFPRYRERDLNQWLNDRIAYRSTAEESEAEKREQAA